VARWQIQVIEARNAYHYGIGELLDMASVFEADTIVRVTEVAEFDSDGRCRGPLQQRRVIPYTATIPHARHFYQLILNTCG
jgi:hypothetical protein